MKLSEIKKEFGKKLNLAGATLEEERQQISEKIGELVHTLKMTPAVILFLVTAFLPAFLGGCKTEASSDNNNQQEQTKTLTNAELETMLRNYINE